MTRNKPLVLVIDDVASIRLLVSHILQRSGADVHETPTGESGLTHAREHGPDLILLDLLLPGMSGLETLKALKSDPATNGIPVIIVTALSRSDLAKEAMDAGAAGLIGKPFTIDQLRSELEEWIGPTADGTAA